MNKKLYILVLFMSFVLVSSPAFAWEKIIAVPYHSTAAGHPLWTGPAAAKMVLESPIITAHPAYLSQTQAQLWTYIGTHADAAWNPFYPGVHTDPEALKECLKNFDTRPGWTFVIHSTSTYDPIISQKIIFTLDHYDVPPAVPIDGGLNWVAVFGANTTTDPSAGPYTINWFLINDPRDPVLGNYRFISYTSWENSGASSVFLHIPTPEPFPHNMQKMAVCDPKEPGPLKLIPPEKFIRRLKIIRPPEARKAAYVALRDNGLLEKREFRMACEMMGSANPVLVRRKAGSLKADYYVVPMARGRMLAGAVLIDAYSGAFLETSIAKKPIPYPYLTQSDGQVREILTRKIMEIEGSKKIKVERPTLVWEPGLSVNPYFPLWKARVKIKGTVKLRYLDYKQKVVDPRKIERKKIEDIRRRR
ncbi:MAG: hypothetical protein KAW12_27880 [Candidatus Aminicenantes bacterium]|nr:hypothetical protein [Candidatus Aminicenantes bacterium]